LTVRGGTRWIGAAAVALAIGAGGASPAWAGRVSVENGTLTYVASPGEENFLSVYTPLIPGYIAVYDEAPVTTGSGCTLAPEIYPFIGVPPDAYVGIYYLCDGVTAGFDIDLDDGDDYFEVEPSLGSVKVVGGAGNDVVYGSDADDTVVGGAGDDRIRTGRATTPSTAAQVRTGSKGATAPRRSLVVTATTRSTGIISTSPTTSRSSTRTSRAMRWRPAAQTRSTEEPVTTSCAATAARIASTGGPATTRRTTPRERPPSRSLSTGPPTTAGRARTTRSRETWNP
jgi:hypothetical protein